MYVDCYTNWIQHNLVAIFVLLNRYMD